MHRLDRVAAAPRQRKHRHASQNPGDVVHQDIAITAEYQGWPDNRIRNAGLSQSELDQRLASVVGQRQFK
jgi:hypothetical protein